MDVDRILRHWGAADPPGSATPRRPPAFNAALNAAVVERGEQSDGAAA